MKRGLTPAQVATGDAVLVVQRALWGVACLEQHGVVEREGA